jgi:nitrogen regulatory protein P-II 1
MKKIEAIVRLTKVNDLYAALEKVGHPGIMVSEIEGRGKTKGIEQQVRGKTYTVEFITKDRIELIVEDAVVNDIVSAIQKAAFTGQIGDGKVFIYPVDDALRVRTAEKGVSAIR